MRNLKLSLVALIAMGGLSYSGGDISPITDYEIEDNIVAEEEAYPEPVIEEEVIVEEESEEVFIPTPPTPEPTMAQPLPTPVPTVAPIPPAPPKQVSANGFYAGLGITGSRYQGGCKCNKKRKIKYKDTTYGVMGRVGYDFNQYIGVEARASKTDWGSDESKVEHVGVYLKPMMPIGNSANAYALVGVGKTKVKGSLPNVDSDGLAVGAGVEVDLSTDIPREGRYSRNFDGHGDQETGLGVFVDYERMVAKRDAPIVDAVSAGVTYDF
jgi:OOP family OmpA-OmpF porin